MRQVEFLARDLLPSNMNHIQPFLFLGIALSVLSSCKPDKEVIHPEYRALVESVYASVTVEPEELYQVFPASSGVLKSVLKKATRF